MNYYRAVQPPHLNGKWQYAQLSKHGGGPICGCGLNEGHDTAEDAERHHYETQLADYISWHPNLWHDLTVQRRCELCNEWTTQRYTIRLRHFHDDVHALCPTCAPVMTEELVRKLVPFEAGAESFGTL